MKFFITKYALVTGIIEKEGEITSTSSSMIQTGRYEFFHRPYWHLTKEDAVERAELLRANKIKSLEKQLAKLKSLKF